MTEEQIHTILRHIDPLTLVDLWLEVTEGVDTVPWVINEPKARTAEIALLQRFAVWVQDEVFSNMGRRWFLENAIAQWNRHQKHPVSVLDELKRQLAECPNDE